MPIPGRRLLAVGVAALLVAGAGAGAVSAQEPQREPRESSESRRTARRVPTRW